MHKIDIYGKIWRGWFAPSNHKLTCLPLKGCKVPMPPASTEHSHYVHTFAANDSIRRPTNQINSTWIAHDVLGVCVFCWSGSISNKYYVRNSSPVGHVKADSMCSVTQLLIAYHATVIAIDQQRKFVYSFIDFKCLYLLALINLTARMVVYLRGHGNYEWQKVSWVPSVFRPERRGQEVLCVQKLILTAAAVREKKWQIRAN